MATLAGSQFLLATSLGWRLAIFLHHRRATTQRPGPADAGPPGGGGSKIQLQNSTSRATPRTTVTGDTGMTATEVLGRRSLLSLGQIRRGHRSGIKAGLTPAVTLRPGNRPGSQCGSLRILACLIFQCLAKPLSLLLLVRRCSAPRSYFRKKLDQ